MCIWHFHLIFSDPFCLLLPFDPLCVSTALCCALSAYIPSSSHPDLLSSVPCSLLTQILCAQELFNKLVGLNYEN